MQPIQELRGGFLFDLAHESIVVLVIGNGAQCYLQVPSCLLVGEFAGCRHSLPRYNVEIY